MARVSRAQPAVGPSATRPPELLRKLIAVAMDLERRTMRLYCHYESLFPTPFGVSLLMVGRKPVGR